MEKGVIVKTNNIKHFTNQEEARKYAIKLLEAGLTFIKIEEDKE